MKYQIVLFALFFGLKVSGQSLDYKSNRIAVSFDGNSEPDTAYKWPTGDPDDWGAAAASLAIIAKLGLQDKLVHCSYNNFIDAPAGPDEENQLKISLEGGAERWGFDKSTMFDVTTQLEAARNNLAIEISKSTKDNPLYLLYAGLTEFLYQAIELVVKDGNISCLEHVYLVSHSKFNENEKRRPHHRNYNDLVELTDNLMKYKKIQDQNLKENPNKLWNSLEDFSVWYWMRDHNDPNIRWMYTRIQAHSGNHADISDCGLFYYLLVGDDNGSPEKFKQFIGDGITID